MRHIRLAFYSAAHFWVDLSCALLLLGAVRRRTRSGASSSITSQPLPFRCPLVCWQTG